MKKSSIFVVFLVWVTLSMAQNVVVTIPSGQTLCFDADEYSAHLYAQDTSLSGYLVLPDSISYWEPMFWPDWDRPYDSVFHTVPVTVIADRAFSNCRHITGITIPATVSYVGIGAFSYCISLDTIIIDEDNPVYASPDGCNAVIDIFECKLVSGCRRSVIPPTVTVIGSNAFRGISGLHSVVLPDSLEKIDGYAFLQCDSLTSIHIPAKVRFVGYGCFSYCWQLDTITVADENPYYDSREQCNAIINSGLSWLVQGCANTVMPASIQRIEQWAFCGMHKLTHISFPNMLEIIQDFAFQDCDALTAVHIPMGVNLIGNNPFVGCISLDTITVDSLNYTYDSRSSCNAIIAKSDQSLVSGCRSTVIPSDIFKINKYAFKGIKGMRRITLPVRLYSIGNEAFAGCTDIETILSASFSAPQLGYSVFQDVNPDIPVHIRRGTLDSYLSEWCYFHNIIEDFPIGIDSVTHFSKDYTLLCHNGQLSITSDIPQPIFVFDMLGRELYHHAATTTLHIRLTDILPIVSGILLVKVGSHPVEKLLYN